MAEREPPQSFSPAAHRTVEDDCVIHDHPVPPEEMHRYTFERDPDAENDIANYVSGQARDETVQHVEKIKIEYVASEPYEIWDVVTDKNRWWVITNITNLYSQKHFPSLDYTLSFHVGLTMRMRSRLRGPDASEPDPFDEISRRHEQADQLHDRAVEAEDYQAVGMQLRESLLALVGVLQRRVNIPVEIERPQIANFTEWSDILVNQLCPGEANKTLRQFLKSSAERTWQLVNWLTHDKRANFTASVISLHATSQIIGHFRFAFIAGAPRQEPNLPGVLIPQDPYPLRHRDRRRWRVLRHVRRMWLDHASGNSCHSRSELVPTSR